MTRIRTLLVVFVVCVVGIGGFLAGRASAQQVTPHEHTAQYSFAGSWGDFKTVIPAGGGYAYFFEATDGSIRNVRVGPAGVEDIELIRRSGSLSNSRGR